MMIIGTLGVSSVYADSQLTIEESPGQTTPPLTVKDSSNVLFQILSDGQAIINQFIQFSGSGLTALRTYVFPDSDGTVVLEDTTQTLTQKTIDADSNTLSNIDDDEIKTGAGIDVTKLSVGSVDNSEFDRLDGLVADIQPQLNAKVDNGENVGTGTGLVFKDKSAMNLRFKSIKAGNNIVITNNADDITINATGITIPNIDGTNVGTGTGLVFKDKSGDNLRFRTVKAGNNIAITNNADDITIDAANTNGANVGTGTGLVFKDKSGNDLRFKTIKAGNNISIVNNVDDITINSTSVGIPNMVRLASDVVITTNVIQDVTGLSFPVAANSVYSFNFDLLYNVGATTTAAGFSINCNGCVIDRIGYTVKQPVGSATAASPTISDVYTRNATNVIATAARSMYTTSNHVTIDGVLDTGGTGGTLIVRGISEVAATPVTVKAGSNGLLYTFP